MQAYFTKLSDKCDALYKKNLLGKTQLNHPVYGA
jgi:hypothetical protein